MKANRFSKIVATGMMAVTPLLWTACSDTWGEHYNALSGGATGQGTLLSNIASDPSLANFYKVIETIGASETLNSPQQFTIWAPVNFTESQADSVIAIYQQDVDAGLKLEDNRAMTQFLQNHMALYTVPVSSLTDDTVAMLNNKYMHLVGTSNTSGSLQGNPFNDAVLCSNGILYKTDQIQTFFPNIREYIKQQGSMDSLSSFITLYDEYELDENASVPGGVVDGKTIYLDSVTNLKNSILTRYGFIQREDSIYTLIAPTDEVWASEYEKYHKYFNYDESVNNADSLADNLTRNYIIYGRFFNTSPGWAFNRHPEDSLCNTMYMQRQSHYPRQNVYYKPESTILSGLEKVECSNGYVYVDNQGVIDPHSTFFGRMDIEAAIPFYYELAKNEDDEVVVRADIMSYETYKDSAETELDKSYSYVQVTATKPASGPTNLIYTIPSTLSGCYYNIYLVTVPNPDRSSRIPLWFQVAHAEKDRNGVVPVDSKDVIKWNYYSNPHPVTADNTENGDVILGQSHNERCYVASAEKVDTILIQSAVKYDYSGAGLDDGVIKLQIGSFGPNSASKREKIYTRTLRLNEIIMIPFETEEEALEAADDKDAFNDKLLEGNKEN